MKNGKRILALFSAFALVFGLVLVLGGCAQTGGSAQSLSAASSSSVQSSSVEQDSSGQASATELDFDDPGDDYKLKQVVVLSRHNIRPEFPTLTCG